MPGIDVTHPEIAAQWHPTKNGGLLPADVTAGSNKKVWWRCPKTCPQGCPHEWESIIANRCKGNGCPCCSQRETSCEHVSIIHTHPDIAAQWHPTKNSTLLPSQFTSGSGKKIWWRCPKTCPQGCPHDWEASVKDRYTGSGCPFCSQRATSCEHVSITHTHPNIAAQWHPMKNGELLPSQFTAGSHKKIWWKCSKTCPQGCTHDWETTIDKRCLAERGCPFCSQNQVSCYHVSITHTHPKIAEQWHPIKNGDLLPSQFTAGSNKKMWWKCPNTCPQGCPHEWVATITSRCGNGNGCPYCSNQIISCEHVSITHTHPDIAAQWHPMKNGDLLPSQFTAGSNKKMWWKCPNTCPQGCPHDWEASVKDRYTGSGCPFCSPNKIKICEHVSITHTHPEIAAQWHPTKNSELLPSQFTASSNKKVWWKCYKTCPQGCPHEWEAVIASRCKGGRCPLCSQRKISCEHVSITHTHPDITAQWHPMKNGAQLPSQFTAGSGKKVWWQCTKNPSHEWNTYIAARCRAGTGCPHCVNKTEVKLHEYLMSLFPDIQSQYRADWCINPHTNRHLPFDFYIPSLKRIIELDGPQHFRQISNWQCHRKTTKRDVYKMQQAEAQGVSMLRLVQEEIIDASPEWLDEHVKPHLIYHETPTQTMLSMNSPDLYADHLQLLADTDTISIEESDISSNGSDEDEEVEDPDSEELIALDDTE